MAMYEVNWTQVIHDYERIEADSADEAREHVAARYGLYDDPDIELGEVREVGEN